MRNGVTGHLQKCIDVAVARGGRSELIAAAQAVVDRSMASRQLAVAMGHEEHRAERLQAAIEEASKAGVEAMELEEARAMLELAPGFSYGFGWFLVVFHGFWKVPMVDRAKMRRLWALADAF